MSVTNPKKTNRRRPPNAGRKKKEGFVKATFLLSPAAQNVLSLKANKNAFVNAAIISQAERIGLGGTPRTAPADGGDPAQTDLETLPP